MRIAVFGNCQAAPLRGLLSRYAGVECPDCPLNYAVQMGDKDEIFSLFKSCDFVVAQRISNSFGVEWVKTAYLRNIFREKLVVWPTVYFDGYYPDIRYLYHKSLGKVVGPLSDYHFDSVIQAYKRSLPPKEASAEFISGKVLERFPMPAQRSLMELRKREKDCDINISNYIEGRFSSHLIQYTPNHPHSSVLREVARQICQFLGLAHCFTELDEIGELDEIYVPPYPAIRTSLNLDFCDRTFKGLEVSINGNDLQTTFRKFYEPEELIHEFFRVYKIALR